MTLIFEKFSKKKSEKLINFLSSEKWEFHLSSNLNKKNLQKMIGNNYYTRKDQITFLINENETLIGLLRIYDLVDTEDETPLFDIKIKKSFRKKGHGLKILNFMLNYIFSNYILIRKVEGTTREDNISMQRLFEKTGFTKVAQFRKDWKGKNNFWYDTIGYDILKEEYLNV